MPTIMNDRLNKVGEADKAVPAKGPRAWKVTALVFLTGALALANIPESALAADPKETAVTIGQAWEEVPINQRARMEQIPTWSNGPQTNPPRPCRPDTEQPLVIVASN